MYSIAERVWAGVGVGFFCGVFGAAIYVYVIFKTFKMKTFVLKIEAWLKGAAKKDVQFVLTYLTAVVDALANGLGVSGIPVPVTGNSFIDSLDSVLAVVLEFMPAGSVITSLSGVVVMLEAWLAKADIVFDTLIQVPAATAQTLVANGQAQVVTSGTPVIKSVPATSTAVSSDPAKGQL